MTLLDKLYDLYGHVEIRTLRTATVWDWWLDDAEEAA